MVVAMSCHQEMQAAVWCGIGVWGVGREDVAAGVLVCLSGGKCGNGA